MLLVSVELDEILSLADRILVVFDGAIVGELQAHQADEKNIRSYDGEHHSRPHKRVLPKERRHESGKSARLGNHCAVTCD